MDTAAFLAAEQRYANAQARTLDADAYARWYDNRSGHRVLVYAGKVLIVYRLMFGTPTILDTITCTGFSLSATEGFKSSWHSEAKGLLVVGHTPYEVAESCFLWHTQSANVEYKRHGTGRSISVTMSWKIPLNPVNRQDGVIYMQEYGTYWGEDWKVEA